MKKQMGFTLLELAIVLVVLTILAAGLLVPLTTSIESRRYKTVTEDMARIQDALIGYAMSHSYQCSYDSSGNLLTGPAYCPNPGPASQTLTHHYLPCPNHDGTGIEARDTTTGACSAPPLNSNLTPLLPWATLGLPSVDPWGDAYGYDVYPDYANNQIGFGSGNAPDPAGAPANCPDPPASTPYYLHIYQSCESSGTFANTLVAGQLAAVIISFGPNGLGAYTPANHPPVAGTLHAANVSPSSSDEALNTLSGTAAKYGTSTAYHNYVMQPQTNSGQFDDIVVGLPFTVLLSRVCSAGSCP